jgi:hypothetical protein
MKVRRMTRRKTSARSSSAMRAVRLSRAARKARSKSGIKVRKNFLPLLALPLVAPLAASGAVVIGYFLYKRTQEVSAIVSVPAVLGGGVGFAVAYQTKADNTMKFVYSVIGYTAGMLVQNYVIAPNVAAATEAKAQEDCNNSSWLTPWKWCW